MLRSIVAGTDGSATSRHAVAEAAELARIAGAHLHLVTAFKESEPGVAAGSIASARMALDDQDETRAGVLALLARLADEFQESGVAVSTHWRSGDVAEGLLDVAEKEKADLIVVGNRGMKGLRRVLGSVPNRISHSAPCDVMIVYTK